MTTQTPWITFVKALEKANKFFEEYPDYKDKNLLIGNGFSIDCCPDIFTYKALLENAEFSEEIQNIFTEFQTMDFEKIINKLQESARLINIYKCDKKLIKQLKIDATSIKEELVNVISKKHPAHQHCIEMCKFYSGLAFLSNFCKIFTLNYDMLSYWTLLKKYKYKDVFGEKATIFDMKDGFGRLSELLTWRRTEAQNVFYLHGALHLFDDGTDIIKAEASQLENLMDSIKNNLDEDKYPLIVAEGDTSEKLAKITHNKYLEYCYEKLNQISGVIFIHGHSFDDNDKHIFDSICKNEYIKQVYIGVFDPDNTFEDLYKKVTAIFATKNKEKEKKLIFYDSKSANIWTSITDKDIEETKLKEIIKAFEQSEN